MIVEQPRAVSLKAGSAKEMMWITFHEGFRCGTATVKANNMVVTPERMESHILEMYEQFVVELGKANSRA